MSFFKKSLIFILSILLCASVYHDMMSGSIPTDKEKSVQKTTASINYNIVKVKILPGDTVLSIVEKYNDSIKSLDVNQIVSDFRKLNEDAQPYQLKTNHYYYIPVYKK